MKSPEFNPPPTINKENKTPEIIEFDDSIDRFKKTKFLKFIDELPEFLKKVFLDFLVWKGTPVNMSDYNLLHTLRGYSVDKSAGLKTDNLLCGILKEIMKQDGSYHSHRDSKEIRRFFNDEWRKINPERTKRREISAQSFKERQASGGTYTDNRVIDSGTRKSIHRKGGHT